MPEAPRFGRDRPVFRFVRVERLHHGMGAHHFQARNAGDEIGDIIVLRVHHDLFRPADLDDPAVAHDRDPVADADRFVEVVGDEHRRLFHDAGKLDELVLQLPPDQRVERTERLVHQQDLGIGGQRPRQADALLHAAGQFVGEFVAPAAELDHLKGALGDFRAFVLAGAADFQRQGYVVQNRAVRHQGEVLEHHGNVFVAVAPQGLVLHREDILAVDQDAAGGRLEQPVDMADERGLAAAGQAHDAEDFAARDRQGDVGDPDDAVEPFQHLGFRDSFGLHGVERLAGPGAENLPDALDLDGAVRPVQTGCGTGGRNGPHGSATD